MGKQSKASPQHESEKPCRFAFYRKKKRDIDLYGFFCLPLESWLRRKLKKPASKKAFFYEKLVLRAPRLHKGF